MKTKMKFGSIKEMLRREEMKNIVGGDAYTDYKKASQGAPSPFVAGTTLSGDQNANLGLTIAPGTNYSQSFNYGAGMTGATNIGTNNTGSGMTTYNNAASNGGNSYAKP